MNNLFFKLIKFFAYPFKEKLLGLSKDFYEKKIFNTGLILSKRNKQKKIKDFSEVEFSSFSQWGDDGIIDWLIEKLNLKNKNFIEIGVQDYWESNTRFILKKRNWNGLLIDMSNTDIKKIKTQSIYWKHNLLAKNHFITRDNVNKIFKHYNFDKKLSLLSLDIDGNDYWILKNMNLKAEILVCEYNGLFGDINEITIPYKKNFNRKNEHYSNLYFGCSIKSLITLLKKKSYIFIGTNSAGNNAYFINKKRFKYIKNKIKNIKIFKPKFRESRNKQNKKTYLNLNESIKKISQKKVINLKNNKIIKIGDIKNFYSKKYLSNS